MYNRKGLPYTLHTCTIFKSTSNYNSVIFWGSLVRCGQGHIFYTWYNYSYMAVLFSFILFFNQKKSRSSTLGSPSGSHSSSSEHQITSFSPPPPVDDLYTLPLKKSARTPSMATPPPTVTPPPPRQDTPLSDSPFEGTVRCLITEWPLNWYLYYIAMYSLSFHSYCLEAGLLPNHYTISRFLDRSTCCLDHYPLDHCPLDHCPLDHFPLDHCPLDHCPLVGRGSRVHQEDHTTHTAAAPSCSVSPADELYPLLSPDCQHSGHIPPEISSGWLG